MKRLKSIIPIVVLCLLLLSCKKESSESCAVFPIMISASHWDATVNPANGIIAYNYRPITSVDFSNTNRCNRTPVFNFAEDSLGLWLINPSTLKSWRALSHTLIQPLWSPDGKSMIFIDQGQPWKMAFDGLEFDEGNKVKFLDAFALPKFQWSPDGTKMTYQKSSCVGALHCGIWIYSPESKVNTLISTSGANPTWLSNSEIFFVTKVKSSSSEGDSLWRYSLISKTTSLIKVLESPYTDNQNFSASAQFQRIAFISFVKNPNTGYQIYTMDYKGSDLEKLTTEGISEFSWGLNGEIIYITSIPFEPNGSQGVMFSINQDGTNKRQITFNRFKTIR